MSESERDTSAGRHGHASASRGGREGAREAVPEENDASPAADEPVRPRTAPPAADGALRPRTTRRRPRTEPVRPERRAAGRGRSPAGRDDAPRRDGADPYAHHAFDAAALARGRARARRARRAVHGRPAAQRRAPTAATRPKARTTRRSIPLDRPSMLHEEPTRPRRVRIRKLRVFGVLLGLGVLAVDLDGLRDDDGRHLRPAAAGGARRPQLGPESTATASRSAC